MSSTSGTQAVDSAAGLLLAVLEASEPPTFADLQASSELAKSTVSRLLSSLERHDLVTRAEDGTVRPGGVLTRFAHSRRPTDELIEAARPHMTALGDATGEKINLAVLHGSEVEQISQIDCNYLIGGVNWGDQRIPLHASALGKVFLAYGAEFPRGRLLKYSSRTITSRARLSEDLALVRERGWALADCELEEGLIAVAAPVFGGDGSVVGALSVSGPTLRMSREVTREYAELLVSAAQATADALGYEGHASDSERATVTQTGGRVGAA